MTRRNLRVLIQTEENLHLLVSMMISTGEPLIVNDKVVACGTDRTFKLRRCRCINEGGINGHRIGPVLCLHPILVCRHGENPAAILCLGQAICHRLGADILGIHHIGGGNPVCHLPCLPTQGDRAILLQLRGESPKVQAEGEGIAAWQPLLHQNGLLHMIAVQFILEIHTGIDLLIHHLGPQAGRGDLLGERRFWLLRSALEQILQGGEQGGKASWRLFLAVRVGDLRHGCPVIIRLGRCLRFFWLCRRIRRSGCALFGNLRRGRFWPFLRLRGRFRLCFRDRFLGGGSLIQHGFLCLAGQFHFFLDRSSVFLCSLFRCGFCLRSCSSLFCCDFCLGSCGSLFCHWGSCSLCSSFRFRDRRFLRCWNGCPICRQFCLRDRLWFCHRLGLFWADQGNLQALFPGCC